MSLFTPLQTVATPISVVCFLCFGRVNALVSTSAVWSGSRQLSARMVPFWTKSRIQCHFVAMCLDRLWNCGFRAIDTAPILSPHITVASLCGNPSSSHRFLNQQASLPALDKATYSASVVDRAITVCFFERQVIAPPAARKTCPDVDLKSSVSA